MNTESKLISKIARAVPSLAGASGDARGDGTLRLGIGDDAAILSPGAGSEWAVSCDAFIEGVHFLVNVHPPDSVGYKSLGRAASDLAAMGAKPRYFLLTLALPVTRTGAWLDGFSKGMARAARELEMRLIGGDTTKSGLISVSVTVVGEAHRGNTLARSGAHAGDVIYVSGILGRARLGLELLKHGRRAAHDKGRSRPSGPLQAHLYPKIRAALGFWLARHRVASAMIDISDGLSTDLARLCGSSEVGARVWVARIPCVQALTARPRPSQRALDPLEMALDGGDDYELLFTVPPGRVKRLRRAPGSKELTPIGEIVRGNQITLVGEDGRTRRLEPRGWDPFRKRRAPR